jgi:Phosphotriesterase family
VIENILRASARAHKATGVPISTHTWAAGRSGDAQQAIFAQEGVDLRRVIIGHSGDTDDLTYLRGLMARGSTIGMDCFGLDRLLPTAKCVEVVTRLCAEGYASQMVLSHDAHCWTDMQSKEDNAGRGCTGTTRISPTTSCPRSARRGSRRSTSRNACPQPARHLRGAPRRAGMSLVRWWQQQGKRAETYALLAPIYGCFLAGFDTTDLREARALLEALGEHPPYPLQSVSRWSERWIRSP